MSKREAFLEAAGKENVDDFLHFIELHVSKLKFFEVLTLKDVVMFLLSTEPRKEQISKRGVNGVNKSTSFSLFSAITLI